MRRLNVSKKTAINVVRELDAFPKVPDDCKETSPSRGGFSIVIFIIIGILVISEIQYYSDTELQFDYDVDTNLTRKIKINIDMTVAMKCSHIGADVLDQTGEDVFSYGQLREDPAYFQLSPKQQEYMDFIQQINDYLRQEYHAIHKLLWRSDKLSHKGAMPPREDVKSGVPDACRIHGSLEVSKVAGNFHVTAGKSVPVIPKGHAHIAFMVEGTGKIQCCTAATFISLALRLDTFTDYNFSHRIDHFSFGDPVPGVVYPLDGTLAVTDSNYHIYQYFVQVVPTEVRLNAYSVDTYQFAVTERNRTINHGEGSHGVPGIFVKYDLSSLLIRVREEHRPYWQFFIRLCGIVGGVFSVSGMIQSFLGYIYDLLCCRMHMGKYRGQGSYDEAVRNLPPNSLPTELPAAPLLQLAELTDSLDMHNSGYR